jgi:chorismate dehydratase
VSYLNAKPLIAGVENLDAHVHYAVPGRLAEQLANGAADLALCPVIDFFRAPQPLQIVPVGGIGCEGPTLTVRLFSQRPLAEVTTVHGDTDSHTSLMLLRVLLREWYGQAVTLMPYTVSTDTPTAGDGDPWPEALLLIGDKVVTAAPDDTRYPYQMDLGQAWHQLTGLPFVFAVWMARPDSKLVDLPRQLDRQRQINARQLEAIVQQYAPAHGWPIDLAREYLTHILQYTIGPRQIEAIEKFAQLAHHHGLIEAPRRLSLTQPVVEAFG